MALVTLQVLEGLERGRVFGNLPTPITIGREDENAIRLNDERVSRFHAKIQEDGERIILTDLDSTNGTRVNGHPVQMKVLQAGDQLCIGRCILVYGSRDDIAARARSADDSQAACPEHEDHTVAVPASSSDSIGNMREVDGSSERSPSGVEDGLAELFPDGPPELPQGLLPVQRAQVSDILGFAHDQIRLVIESAAEDQDEQEVALKAMCVDWHAWQRLIRLEANLAHYWRSIAEPD